MAWYNSALSPPGISSKHRLTRRTGLKLALSALCARRLRAGEPVTKQLPDLTLSIPPRLRQALTGSQFAESISNLDHGQREQAILDQLLEGNLPGLLRKLVPVRLTIELARGKKAATIFAMPEYLAIGSDGDFLRIPMSLHTAAAIAKRFRFILPTKKIVDAIYEQSTHRLTPQPLTPGPQMTSTEYYQTHNALIESQSKARGFPSDALVAGHKKDVVVTNRLRWKPGRIAIYGWHRAPQAPIQPLSTVHGAGYADYSHGIRLIAGVALIEGALRSVNEILQDTVLAAILSDEGPISVELALATA